MMAAQQTSAVASASTDDDEAFEGAVSGTQSSVSGNNLTGGTTGTLNNQTLQALLNLTQTDPADAQQTQGTQPRHHRHHGGGMHPPANVSNDSSTDPATNAAGSTDNNDASDDLTAATG